MKVLALESSTDMASVALLCEGALIGEKEFPSKRSLCADLFPVLWELLEGVSFVERIVVGLGPGSYAGVRIAVAAAMGLQSVWGCELVGIPSVAALATCAKSYRVLGDARRGAWHYSRVVSGVCVEGPLLVESDEALGRKLSEEDSPLYACEDLRGIWPATVCLPSARELAGLAFAGRGILQREKLEPLYLKEPHITGVTL